jgi:hypothetical protein
MANQKVSDLPALSGADVVGADLLYIVDSSAGVAGSKKITVGQYQVAPVSAGTANGVVYLDASKIPASGADLVYNGTNFGVGVASPAAKFDLGGDYKEKVNTANTGTAYTINLSDGTIQILTLTGNCTFTFPTATAGKSFMILLKQDATGSRTVTWPAAVKWPNSTAPTITSTASRLDKYVFTADGTNWYGSNGGQNYTV